MHDIRAIRENRETYVQGWAARGVSEAEALVAELAGLDEQLRAAQTAGQAAQAKRNELSKGIGQAKARKDEAEAGRLLGEVEALKASGAAEAEAEKGLVERLRERLAGLPNLAAEDVPPGEDEAGNVEQKRVGEPRRGGPAKDHVDLGEALELMDFEAAARMSGARFVVLKGQLARLERALAQFMLDIQTTEHGYTEVSPPAIVGSKAMFGTGQLPKFTDDLFEVYGENIRESFRLKAASDALDVRSEWQDSLSRTLDELERIRDASSIGSQSLFDDLYSFLNSEFISRSHEFKRDMEVFESVTARFIAMKEAQIGRYFLIPTAEVSLTNLVREQITPAEQLPLRLTACTPCFRAEAGASGRDTRGMIRQHQFLKVELVSITAPEDSEAEHERMTACAEAVLERLELPYRRMLLCRGDMGFSAKKTFDLEVWLPSQGTYREISSCSNCGDFQARRMDARFKRAGQKGTEFVHTLNGSGLAVGRTLVAVMENYQDEGGRIVVPEALRPYMGGVSHIGGKA